MDSQLDILFNLRRKTRQITALSDTNEAKKSKLEKCIEIAQDGVSKHQSQSFDNAKLILDWLTYLLKENTPNTIHHKLVDICILIKLCNQKHIVEFLNECDTSDILPPNSKSSNFSRYFSSLRSFYEFVTKDNNFPKSLGYRKAITLTSKTLISQDELIGLIKQIQFELSDHPQLENTNIQVSDYVVVLVIILSYSGLRFSEAIGLCVGDITITDRITVVAVRKGTKRITTEVPKIITPEWVLMYLASFWKAREQEVGGDLRAYLFTGEYFVKKADDNMIDLSFAREKLRKLLKNLGIDPKFHILRRYFANQIRNSGLPLLEVSNLLGHSTTTTAPKSYIQCFPLIQKKQLKAWSSTQNHLELNLELFLSQIATSLGMTREGIFKMVVKAQSEGIETNFDGSRSAKLSINEINQILIHRIHQVECF
jgi:integrase